MSIPTLQSVEIPGTRRPGQTGIYRRAGVDNGLISVPEGMPEIRNMHDVFQHGLRLSPNGPYLGRRPFDGATKTYGSYVWETYTEVNQRIMRFGSGVLRLHQDLFGLDQPAKEWSLGIWAVNRPEWTIAAAACASYDLVSVGLYDTLGPEAVTYGLQHSECSICVTSIEHVASLLNDTEKIPILKVIISMDSLSDDTAGRPGFTTPGSVLRTWAKSRGVQLYDWAEIEALGAQFGRAFTPPQNPDAICTHCYTSGTTGNPKAALLTHANFVAVLGSALTLLIYQPSDTLISFLPLPHVFGRLVEMFMTFSGGKIGCSTGNTLTLLEDIADLKPTLFPAVPRLLNRVYAKVFTTLTQAPGLAGILARRGLATKMENLKNGQGNQHALWDRILFSKVKQALGGQVHTILVGSAPVAAEVLAFLRVSFCCEVIEAYGQTEGTGAATITMLGENTAGHVGAPAACNDFKLVDVPELKYFVTDQPYPRGEICVRGRNVIPGYLKEPKKTAETIDSEGWLHSGDVGSIDHTGRITVIDRIKNVFKLSQGEFVCVEKIENALGVRVPILQQIFLHGVSTEAFLVAMGIPDPETFVPFAKRVLMTCSDLGLTSQDIEAMIELVHVEKYLGHPKLRKAVLQEILRASKEADLKGFEIPKAIVLSNTPFTIENELLTPTFKIKRQPVVKLYKDTLDALYAEANASISKI